MLVLMPFLAAAAGVRIFEHMAFLTGKETSENSSPVSGVLRYGSMILFDFLVRLTERYREKNDLFQISEKEESRCIVA